MKFSASALIALLLAVALFSATADASSSHGVAKVTSHEEEAKVTIARKLQDEDEEDEEDDKDESSDEEDEEPDDEDEDEEDEGPDEEEDEEEEEKEEQDQEAQQMSYVAYGAVGSATVIFSALGLAEWRRRRVVKNEDLSYHLNDDRQAVV